jgi:prepilin-type processing-associated H-X9-DG protein
MQLATILYAQDNGDKMVAYMQGGSYGNLWIEAIADYCEDIDEVRYCPNTKPGNRYVGNAKTSWQWYGYTGTPGTTRTVNGSYAINGWFYRFSNGFYARHGTNPLPDFHQMKYTSISNVKSSSSTPFFADSVWVDVWPVDTEVCSDNLNLDGNYFNGSPNSMTLFSNIEKLLTNRHGQFTNVSFIDGHQEAIALDMMWILKWNAKFVSQGKMTRQPSGAPVYRKE